MTTPPPPKPGKGRGARPGCGTGPEAYSATASSRPAGVFVGAAYNAIPNILTGPTGLVLTTAQRAESAAVKRLIGVEVRPPRARSYAKDESAEYYNKAVDAAGTALSDAWEWVNQDARRGNTSPGWTQPIYEGMQSSQAEYERAQLRSRMSTADGALFVEEGTTPDQESAAAVRAVILNEDPGG